MAYSGSFRPKNPQKYIGNPTNIIYRSSWERRFMIFCDMNESVLEWGSEEVIIPYVSPLDNKIHRYFPDFLIKIKTRDGHTEVRLIEVKPYSQCIRPEVPTRTSKSFLEKVKNWGINTAKWQAAEKFAEGRGWKFQLLTEKELNRGK